MKSCGNDFSLSYQAYYAGDEGRRGRSCLIIALFALGLLLLSCTAFIYTDDTSAEKFTADDVVYKTMTDSTAEVVGCNNVKELNIPSSVLHFGKTYSVRSLGHDAFKGCKSLISVNISDGIPSLDGSMFKDCRSLNAINIAEGNSNYCSVGGILFNKDKTALIKYPAGKTEQSYTIPVGVTSIADSAFCCCKALASVNIGDGVTSIGKSAFKECGSLTVITISDSVKSFGKNAFDGCRFFDYDGKKEIKNYSKLSGYTYSGKSSSKLIRLCNVHFNVNGGSVKIKGMDIKEGDEFTLPEYIGTRDGYIFVGWSYGDKAYDAGDVVIKVRDDMGFTAVWEPGVAFTEDGVKYRALSNTKVEVTGCDKSRSGDLVIPSSVTYSGSEYIITSIGGSAFKNCKSLISVTIGDGIKSLGSNIFDGCQSLTGINVAKGNGNYCSVNGVLFDKGKTTLIQYPAGKTEQSYTVPAGVASIADYAFNHCKALISITISVGVTSIGRSAFQGCGSLTSVTIPDSVISFGKDAFGGCRFFDHEGKKEIKDYSKLPGYIYSGKSSSKLIRFCNVLFDVDGGSVKIDGFDAKEGEKIILPEYTGTKKDRVFSGWLYDGEFHLAGETVTKVGAKMKFIAVWATIVFEEDGIKYKVISDKTVKIIDCTKSKSGDVFLLSTIKHCYRDYSVVSIGDYAFYGCKSLNSVTIPDSVASIGDSAFEGCKAMTSVILPDSVIFIGDFAFHGCESLNSVTIPGVTSIGDSVFNGCTKLISVTISKDITSIGRYAFYECMSLTSVTSDNGVSLTEEHTFEDCNLTSIIIPGSVKSIGDFAFASCIKMTAVIIGDGTESIGISAFNGCESLVSAIIGKGVTHLGAYAFDGCGSLTFLTILGSIKDSGEDSFGECTFYDFDGMNKLRSPSDLPGYIYSGKSSSKLVRDEYHDVMFDERGGSIHNKGMDIGEGESFNLPEYGGLKDGYVFAGWTYGDKVYKAGDTVTKVGMDMIFNAVWVTGPLIVDGIHYVLISNEACEIVGFDKYIHGDLTIPSSITCLNREYSVTSIQDFAFQRCLVLTSVTIPDSVTSIGNCAFIFCMSLTSVTISKSVTYIGDSAFFGCASLTSVTIGSRVIYIGDCAFQYCKYLTSVTIPDSVTFLGMSAFSDCRSLVSVTLGESIPEILFQTFNNCISLTSIVIPGSVKSIDPSAFVNCKSLTSVIICKGVESIYQFAFEHCNLTMVIIPKGVKYIHPSAFTGCFFFKSNGIILTSNHLSGYAYFGKSSYKLVRHELHDVFFNEKGGSVRVEGMDVDKGHEFTLPQYTGTKKDCAFIGWSFGDKVYKAGETVTKVRSVMMFTAVWISKFTVCGIEYKVTSDTAVEVTGCDKFKTGEIVIPSSVTYHDKVFSVVSIGAHAFNDCESITSVAIQYSDTFIDDTAFSGCTFYDFDGKTKIEDYHRLSGYKYICESPSKLIRHDFHNVYFDMNGGSVNIYGVDVRDGDEFILPEYLGVKKDYTFDGWAYGNTVYLPGQKMTKVSGDMKFTAVWGSSSNSIVKFTAAGGLCSNSIVKFTAAGGLCSNSIVKFTVDGIDYEVLSCTTVEVTGCDKSKSGDFVIPSSVAHSGRNYRVISICDSAFYGYESLTSVVIPDSVISLGDSAFYGCKSLTSIVIPDNVTSLGDSAFYGCESLTSVVIPDSVTSIGTYAFGDCISLIHVVIPKNIKIDSKTFSCCTFYDSHGKHRLHWDKLPGYVYFGESSSKLVRHEIHNVLFNENGGSVYVEGADIEERNEIILPEYSGVKKGLAFIGWSHGGEFYRAGQKVIKVSGDMMFTAVWAPTKFTAEGINYNVISDTAVEVTGCDKSKPRDIILPSSVIYCKNVYNVISICESAFKNCTSLTSVTIPDSVISLGGSAFHHCTSLRTVTIGNGVRSIDEYTFRDCRSLTSVIFGNGTTSIGRCAFSGCESLTSVTVPDSVTSIGRFAFYHCTSLKSATIGDGTTSIGMYAFYECKSLTFAIIPGSVTSIEHDAFGGCRFFDFDGKKEINDCSELPGYRYSGESSSKLVRYRLYNVIFDVDGGSLNLKGMCVGDGEGFTLPEYTGTKGGNTFIGWSYGDKVYDAGDSMIKVRGDMRFTAVWVTDAFTVDGIDYKVISDKTVEVTGCDIPKPGDLIIPSSVTYCGRDYSVTSIGSSAFGDCILVSISIPDSVTSISSSAFEDCRSLINLKIGCGVKCISERLFKGLKYLTSVDLGKGIESIGAGAFENCTSLVSVTIPDSVTSIGELAFYKCTSLGSVILPDSVISIGILAFFNCTSLDSMVISDSVVSIGELAFYRCKSITTLKIGSSITSLNSNVFKGCKSLTEINVSEGNSNYCSVNGLLFNKDKTTLIKCPEGKIECTIPVSVTSIADHAFDYCTSLTSLTIPKGVISIGRDAFDGCRFFNFDGKKEIKDCSELSGYTYYGESLSKLIRHNTHNVLFNENGGSEMVEGVDVDGGGVFTIPDYCGTKTGNIFIGWSYNGKVYKTGDTVTKVSSDMGFTALWAADAIKADGINYKIVSDKIVEVTGCDKSKTDIILPLSITYYGRDYSVTSISSSAFSDCISLISLTIPDSIISISGNAFKDCKSLTTLKIGDWITSLESCLFKDCKSLTTLKIGDGVTFIDESSFKGLKSLTTVNLGKSIKSIGDCAFEGCISLNTIALPDSVKSIGSHAFCHCTSLGSLIIPDSVKSIGSGAFEGGNSIISVKIGSGFTSLGNSAFEGCRSLIEIIVSEENSNYCSVNGVLFNKEKTVLIQYPAGKTENSYTIPVSVTAIADHAFYGCSSLTSLTIPDSVTSISHDEFKGYRFFDFDGKKEIKRYSELPGYTYSGESSSKMIRLCNVRFDVNGGSMKEKWLNIDEGKEFTLPQYTGVKKGHVFNGWSYNGVVHKAGEPMIKVSGDMIFTAVWATDIFTADGIDYKIISDKTVEIIGCDKSKSGDIIILSSVSYIDRIYSVVSICESAFKECSSIKSVTLPDSVKSIGANTFKGCRSLAEIKVSEGNSDYCSLDGVLFSKDETKLIQCPEGKIECSIPDIVISIDEHAFHDCISLKILTIGDGIKTLDRGLFKGCTSLTTLKIGNGVRSVGDSAFKGCKSLTSVTIPGSVLSIGKSAFQGCRSLTSVTIPDSIISIGHNAFSDCRFYDLDGKKGIKDDSKLPGYTYFGELSSKLIRHNPHNVLFNENGGSVLVEGIDVDEEKAFTLPEYAGTKGSQIFIGWSYGDKVYDAGDPMIKVRGDMRFTAVWAASTFTADRIDYKAISDRTVEVTGCDRSRTDLNLPSSVRYCDRDFDVVSISKSAFKGCQSLTAVTICDGVTCISEGSFKGLKSLSTVYLGKGIRSIGDRAFEGCTSLNTITLLDSVESIGSYAFCHCTSLASAAIPGSVMSLGASAFEGCKSLSSVIIGNGVKSLDNRLFKDCDHLKSVTIPDSVISIGSYAFEDCTSLTSVIIGKGTVSVGEYAFSLCKSLTSVTIPGNVTSIGKYAFGSCVFYDFDGKMKIKDYSELPGYTYVGESSSKLIRHNLPNVHFNENGGSVPAEGDDVNEGDLFIPSEYIRAKTCSISAEALYGNKTGAAVIKVSGDAPFAAVQGTTFTEDGIEYKVISDKTAEVKCCDKSKTDIIIPSSVTHSDKIYGIISIDRYAFNGCTSLTSLTIGDGITSINDDLFKDCKALKSIILGNGIKSIVGSPFWYCTSLTTITIGNGVTSISTFALTGCKSLTDINISEGNSKYRSVDGVLLNKGGTTLIQCPAGRITCTIPDDVTSIAEYAFYGCTSLTALTIGKGIKSINESLFKECRSLTSVAIGKGITSIADGLFKDCKFIINVTIPDSVTSIGCYTFENCTSLTSLVIPKSVLDVGVGAFFNCNSLVSVTIGGGIRSIGNSTFTGCNSLTSIAIPDNIESIGDRAFYGCTALTSVTIPDSVKYFGKCAFGSCIFYDFDGKMKIEDYSELPGYIYFGESPSKLIRHESRNVLFNENGGSVPIKGMDVDEGKTFTLPEYTGTKAEQIFAGWSYDGKVYKAGDPMTKVSSGMIFTAVWAADKFTADGIDYKIISDKTVKITGCDLTKSGDLIIPSSVTYCCKSYDVVSIGKSAFNGCISISTVIIPDSVTFIEGSAFHGCISLISVTIPCSVVYIEYGAFDGCRFFDSDGKAEIINYTELPGYVYFGESSSKLVRHDLHNVLFNENGGSVLIEGIDVDEGKTFTLPEYTGTKAGLIFAGWSYGGEFYKPGVTVTKVSGYMRFTAVWVSKTFTADGIDYKIVSVKTAEITCCNISKSGDIIISSVTYYGSEYEVISIGDYAFKGCISISSVTLSDNVTSVGVGAFKGCKSMISVKIGNGIISLDKSVFKGCQSLSAVTIGDMVTCIAESSFKDLKSLATVNFGNCIESIGDRAFEGCISLNTITLPDCVKSIGVGAFKGCKSMISVKIGSGVTSLDNSVFKDCRSLTKIDVSEENSNYCSVDGLLLNKDKTTLILCPEGKIECTIPDSVVSIGRSAFYGCRSLTSVTIPESVRSFGKDAFDGCRFFDFDGKNKIKSYSELPGYTYSGKSSSKLIRLCNVHFDVNGGSTKVIGLNLDKGKGFTLPGYAGTKKGCIFIGWSYNGKIYRAGDSANKVSSDMTFTALWATDSFTADGIDYRVTSERTVEITGCDRSKAEDIVLPSSATYLDRTYSVASICGSAFKECTSMISVTIPNSVKSIGVSAFKGCRSLAEIKVSEGNSDYCSVDGVLFSKDGTKLIQCPEGKIECNIPNTVISIDGHAFCNCVSLETLTIGNGVKTLDRNTFKGCRSLASVIIGEGVISIGKSAFSSCKSLVSLTIPDNVQFIGDSAFKGCKSLTSVTIPGGVVSIGHDAFKGCKFYDLDGKKEIKDVSKLHGYTYFGVSASKLIRHDLHNILFNENGGSEMVEGVDVDGGKVFTLPDYCGTRAGNIFIGWSYNGNLYKAGESMTKVSSDMRFTAVWAANVFTADGIYYKIISDRTVKITGCDRSISGDIRIPLSVTYFDKAYDVVSIGKSAFKDCISISSVIISDSVISIGKSAFHGCKSLIFVTIPDSVRSIGHDAFGSCSFFDFGGMMEIKDFSELPGYTYFGDLSSKLIRHVSHNVLFNESGGSVLVEGIDTNEGDVFTLPEYAGMKSDHLFNGWSCCGKIYRAGDTVTKVSGDMIFTAVWVADIFTADGIDYKIISDKTVKVTGCDRHKTGDIILPSSVTYYDRDYTVTSIGKSAFNHCESVFSLTIPDSITSIEDSVFKGCAELISVIIGNGVRHIGSSAFEECLSLTSVIIGNSVVSIGDYAFFLCLSLTSITIPDSVKTIADNAFASVKFAFPECRFFDYDGRIEIKDYSELHGYTYSGECSSKLIRLCNVHFDVDGGSIKVKGLNIDKGKVFTLPEYTWMKEDHIFKGWSYDGRVYKAGDSMTKVSGDMIFTAVWAADAFTADGIHYKVMSSKTVEVTGCDSSRSGNIILPQSVTYIDRIYSVASISRSAFNDCSSPFSLTIPDSIKTLESSVFKDCTELTSVILGNSVTSIGDYVFEGCKALVSVIIGEGVTSIGSYAFCKCTSLTSVTILGKITSISSNAFDDYPFYDYDGKTRVPVCSLQGYMFLGELPSKLIRHEIHNVIFDEKGGSVIVNGVDINAGAEFILPEYTGTKAGYTFAGWSYGGVIYQAGQTLIKVSSDMIFTAVWKSV